MTYHAKESRYQNMTYQRCGKSGIKLPKISLGLWHNFGDESLKENRKELLFTAFDQGITHFDLANNYGPKPGSAEKNFGKILNSDLKRHRDELLISTKAGYLMWPGPYGEWGSRKNMLASLDQSLKRMQCDYVDIFYSHRPDPETPIAETMGALHTAVQQGKALYIGLSNYDLEQTREAISVLKQLGTPCLIHQHRYNMTNWSIEQGLQDLLATEGVGSISFRPLAQGLLTSKYLTHIPEHSRMNSDSVFLNKDQLTPQLQTSLIALHNLAQERNQTLAQMALSWVLRDGRETSALIGASRKEQIVENIAAIKRSDFTPKELNTIHAILNPPA